MLVQSSSSMAAMCRHQRPQLLLQRPAAAAARAGVGSGGALARQQQQQQQRRRRRPAVAPQRATAEDSAAAAAAMEPDVEDAVEQFMKRQAELESGAAFARTKDPAEVIGADVIDEEGAAALCREAAEILRTLKATRDMTVNEARLTVAIEDPRTREQRQLGIEDARGVSRDEMAAALVDVAAGRVPKDRLALKCLLDDMRSWPFLDAEQASNAAAERTAAAGGASSSGGGGDKAGDAARPVVADGVSSIAKPYMLGRDARKGDQPQGLADLLPDWVGYGTLYGISAIPVAIIVSVALILFYNSLK